MKKINKKNGFTLLELMIASGLGVMMMVGLGTILTVSRSNSITQNNISKIQNDFNFVFDKMNRDFRNAGFRGCMSNTSSAISNTNIYNTISGTPYQSLVIPIQPYTGNGTAFLPTPPSTVTAIGANTNFDFITVRETTTDPLNLTTDMATSSSALVTTGTVSVAVNDYAIISSCNAASVFQVGAIAGNTITPVTTGIGYAFPSGAQIYKYQTIYYYVKTVNSVNNLYRQLDGGQAELLIPNIEQFKVLYGLDTNADQNADKYVYANSITVPQNIVSIKVGIVTVAQDNFTVSNKANYSYQFFNSTVTPGDSKLRKVIYLTTNLRNLTT
jgi:type IV pilus assembly protein PilW